MLQYLFLILSILLISLGQILQKRATEATPFIKFFENHHLSSIFTHSFLFSTIALALSTVLWVLSLSGLDLSIANPSLSLSYVIVMISAKIIYGEQIPKRRWVGIFLIIVGIIVIYSS